LRRIKLYLRFKEAPDLWAPGSISDQELSEFRNFRISRFQDLDSQKLRFNELLELELGAWSLELGAWSLELGAWSLELGAWSLELGAQKSALVVPALGSSGP
jgi:hypothetical protein